MTFAGAETFRIAPKSGAAFKLMAGQKLMVVDPLGEQVSDLICFDWFERGERLSPGRSIDYADTLFLTKGHFLYSSRSEIMMEIVHDDCGRHDFLMPPCSNKMFQIVNGDTRDYESCHGSLARALADFDVKPDDICGTFNIFMNVEIGAGGSLSIARPRSKAGDKVIFEAKKDLLVGLTACAHPETNAGVCKPVEYCIFN